MDNDSGQEILTPPTPPTPAAKEKKHPVDGVFGMLKIGNVLLSLIFILLAVAAALYFGYARYDNRIAEERAGASVGELIQYKPETGGPGEPSEGAERLAAINEDYRAWLTIYDTTIDYPVVQGEDNQYYTSHDFYGNDSATGTVFLAAGNRSNLFDSYNIFYGQTTDSGAMFGLLDRFRDRDFYRAHRTGTVTTEYGVYDITLFAVIHTDAYEDRIYTTGNRVADVIDFLEGSRERDIGIGTKVIMYDRETAQDAKRVIALSTRTDADTRGRMVLLGTMVPRKRGTTAAEETAQPEPETTDKPDPSGEKTPGKQEPETTETGRTVTLTVRYLAEDEEVFPAAVNRYREGDSYYVVSPQYPGYTVNAEIVRGSIKEDKTVDVRYTPKTYQVTVQYITIDGTAMAEPYTAEVRTGEAYRLYAKPIEGYQPLTQRISGTNPGRDEAYTVFYVPEGETTELIQMRDYEKATGTDHTTMQTGICFE